MQKLSRFNYGKITENTLKTSREPAPRVAERTQHAEQRTSVCVCLRLKVHEHVTRARKRERRHRSDFLRLRLGRGLKRGLREGQVTANVPRSSGKS